MPDSQSNDETPDSQSGEALAVPFCWNHWDKVLPPRFSWRWRHWSHLQSLSPWWQIHIPTHQTSAPYPRMLSLQKNNAGWKRRISSYRNHPHCISQPHSHTVHISDGHTSEILSRKKTGILLLKALSPVPSLHWSEKAGKYTTPPQLYLMNQFRKLWWYNSSVLVSCCLSLTYP